MKGGPTLHEEDRILFANGVLHKNEIYTLRKGEIVRNIDDTLIVLDKEMIKIKGQRKSWACMFYDDTERACTIYENRPAECRALKCWEDPKQFKKVMARPHLQRKDLIKSDDGILKIIEAHEQKCSYTALRSAVKDLGGPHPEKAVEKILDLIQYDYYLRPLLEEKFNIDPNEMDFFFGRPLTTTIIMFGLCVRKKGDTFVLAPAESSTDAQHSSRQSLKSSGRRLSSL